MQSVLSALGPRVGAYFLGFFGLGADARGTARLPALPFKCPLPLPLLVMCSVSARRSRLATVKDAESALIN